jgi:hypothetical protein
VPMDQDRIYICIYLYIYQGDRQKTFPVQARKVCVICIDFKLNLNE